MAEAWTRTLKNDQIEAYSAGVETQGLNLNAVQVMAEEGIDISQYRSKSIDEFKGIHMDAVITVCDQAHETCPYFPSHSKIIHVAFDDPPKLARKLALKGADKDSQMACYRNVRDQIRAFVETLPDHLEL